MRYNQLRLKAEKMLGLDTLSPYEQKMLRVSWVQLLINGENMTYSDWDSSYGCGGVSPHITICNGYGREMWLDLGSENIGPFVFNEPNMGKLWTTASHPDLLTRKACLEIGTLGWIAGKLAHTDLTVITDKLTLPNGAPVLIDICSNALMYLHENLENGMSLAEISEGVWIRAGMPALLSEQRRSLEKSSDPACHNIVTITAELMKEKNNAGSAKVIVSCGNKQVISEWDGVEAITTPVLVCEASDRLFATVEIAGKRTSVFVEIDPENRWAEGHYQDDVTLSALDFSGQKIILTEGYASAVGEGSATYKGNIGPILSAIGYAKYATDNNAVFEVDIPLLCMKGILNADLRSWANNNDNNGNSSAAALVRYIWPDGYMEGVVGDTTWCMQDSSNKVVLAKLHYHITPYKTDSCLNPPDVKCTGADAGWDGYYVGQFTEVLVEGAMAFALYDAYNQFLAAPMD